MSPMFNHLILLDNKFLLTKRRFAALSSFLHGYRYNCMPANSLPVEIVTFP